MAYVGAGVLVLPRAAGGAGAAQGCAVLAIVAAASVRVCELGILVKKLRRNYFLPAERRSKNGERCCCCCCC